MREDLTRADWACPGDEFESGQVVVYKRFLEKFISGAFAYAGILKGWYQWMFGSPPLRESDRTPHMYSKKRKNKEPTTSSGWGERISCVLSKLLVNYCFNLVTEKKSKWGWREHRVTDSLAYRNDFFFFSSEETFQGPSISLPAHPPTASGVTGWNLSGSSPQMALVTTSQCLRPFFAFWNTGLKSHQSGQDSCEVKLREGWGTGQDCWRVVRVDDARTQPDLWLSHKTNYS